MEKQIIKYKISTNDRQLINEPISNSLIKDFKRLLTFDQSTEIDIPTDFTIETNDNKSFNVHRFILMVRSKYFATLFHNELWSENCNNVMHFNDIDSLSMKIILKYIYCSIFDTSETNFDQLLNLLIIADRFILHDLIPWIIYYIYEELTLENGLDLYLLLNRYSIGYTETLYDSLEQFLMDFGYALLQLDKMFELNPDMIIRIVADSRFVAIEDDVATFILKYINQNSINDELCCQQLIELIHFPMIINCDTIITQLLSYGINPSIGFLFIRKIQSIHQSNEFDPSKLKYRLCYDTYSLKCNDLSSLPLVNLSDDDDDSIKIQLSHKFAFNCIDLCLKTNVWLMVQLEYCERIPFDEELNDDTIWTKISQAYVGKCQFVHFDLPNITYARMLRIKFIDYSLLENMGKYNNKLKMFLSLAMPNATIKGVKASQKWYELAINGN
ncbi:hypothetical protein RDWZM_009939 [Blomia tropicalis]|uniref:BTB domain-containing protein n=1 Tax=Blomia tropicalis TaxID=40697 RepID=A0A9Q0RI71_BLOTA|nr:hypothetical protein RDWZM_009939 [Blomia tropicalis]